MMKSAFYLLAASFSRLALSAGAVEAQSEYARTAFAAEAKTPVSIDGVLDEAVWKEAQPVRRMMAMTGLPFDASDDRTTELRFAFDENFVYVAAKCRAREDFDAGTKTGEVRRDGGGKWDNVLELYFDPGRTLNNFTVAFIYADGTSFGMSDFQHVDPPRGIRYAMCTSGREWTVELAFPAGGRAVPGGQWGFNAIRYTPGYGILCMWRYISDAFQTPGCFGRLMLGAPKDWFGMAGRRLVADVKFVSQALSGDSRYAPALANARQGVAALAKARSSGASPDEMVAMYDSLAADVVRLVDTATARTVIPMTLVKHWNCDDWYWDPFSYAGTQALSRQVAAGETPTFEYKGPIVRKCSKWFPDVGRAVEGVKGTGWRLMPRSSATTVGIHGYFGGVFSPGRRYKLEGYLKGSGKFSFITLFNCIDLKTGENKLYRCITVHSGSLSPEWTKLEVEFELPKLPEGLRGQEGNPFGITIPAETDFAVDELRIWEM